MSVDQPATVTFPSRQEHTETRSEKHPRAYFHFHLKTAFQLYSLKKHFGFYS